MHSSQTPEKNFEKFAEFNNSIVIESKYWKEI